MDPRSQESQSFVYKTFSGSSHQMATLRKIKIYQRRYFKYDLMAGVVVFLIAVPLCLGIALASGAPLFAGIISGIIGGIVVGSISASPVSVSGPAAGLVTIVLAAIMQLGGFNVFLTAVLLAGFLQIIIGILRAGFIADYVPFNVIQGLLCAIGILIIIKQLPLAFTHPVQTEILMESLKEEAQTFSMSPLFYLFYHINLGATIISLISLFILIAGDKIKNDRYKIIPAPVVVVVLGILINETFIYLIPTFVQDSAQLVNIPVNTSLNGFLSELQFPSLQGFLNPNVYFFGALIAVISSLETLLNLRAAEKLDKRRRYSSPNRELIAQGFGNMLAGLVGGLPITSVVVRSSVNIQTGARTKFATIIHGFLLLSIIVVASKWLNRIPLASLAAILIYVGYKLSKISIYKDMYAQGFERFFPFVITILAIVFINLLMGIVIGLVIGFFFILRSNSRVRLDIIQEMHPSGIVRRMILPQQVSFLRKAGLIAELNSIPQDSQLIIDASHTEYIDKDILELIKEFKETQAIDKKIALNLVGFKQHYDIHDHIDFISVTTYDVQASLTPREVLKILQEGNQRFLKDQRIHRNLLHDIKMTSQGQHPIAVILGCIDSRVPVETIFDMGVGDVFCVRVAGNVISKDIIGSIEFACRAGAKLIVVLGHTRCGAIDAACHGEENGYINQLLDKIKPAINSVKMNNPGLEKNDEDFLLEITKFNVTNSVQVLTEESEVLKELLAKETIGIVSAIYHVENGQVDFLPSQPHQFSKIHYESKDLGLQDSRTHDVGHS